MEVYNEETLEGPWNIASLDSKTWSYHWLVWNDVDADGLKDVMAARLVNFISIKHYFLKFLFCWKSPIPKLLMREFFLEMEGDIPLPDKIRKIIFVSLGKSVKLPKAYSV